MFQLDCTGVGALTVVEVTSAGNGRGVGRIIEGGKGVVMPVTVVFELLNMTTGEELFSETEEFARGHRNRTCSPFGRSLGRASHRAVDAGPAGALPLEDALHGLGQVSPERCGCGCGFYEGLIVSAGASVDPIPRCQEDR